MTQPSVSASLWGLAAVFAPLSMVTIGGGQSAVADINRQVVDVHHWMTQAQFLDAFAISRMAPGPGSLLVTLIGWQVAGFWGAVVATLSIFGPTAVLIYGVAHVWSRNGDASWKRALETGLRPVAAGMILAATYVLMRELSGGRLAQFLVLVSTAVFLTSRTSPLIVLGLGSAVFAVLHSLALL